MALTYVDTSMIEQPSEFVQLSSQSLNANTLTAAEIFANNIFLNNHLRSVSLSTGTVQGLTQVNSINDTVDILGNAEIFGNVTIYGSLTALSGLNLVQTNVLQTSALSVVNTGLGPALYVSQGPSVSGIAVFVGSGQERVKINNVNPLPNQPSLTVAGSISASKGVHSDDVYTKTLYTNNYIVDQPGLFIFDTVTLTAVPSLALPNTGNDISLTTTAQTTITAFTNVYQGCFYFLTNKGSHLITLSATPFIITETENSITLPVSTTCLVKGDINNTVYIFKNSEKILPTVTNYLSTSNVVVSSLNTINQLLSSNVNLINIFALSSTTFTNIQTVSSSVISLSNSILPTVTNYLSTSNVRLSSLTVTDNISATGTASVSALNIVSGSIFPKTTFNNLVSALAINVNGTTLYMPLLSAI
jgi:hypothetical protein